MAKDKYDEKTGDTANIKQAITQFNIKHNQNIDFKDEDTSQNTEEKIMQKNSKKSDLTQSVAEENAPSEQKSSEKSDSTINATKTNNTPTINSVTNLNTDEDQALIITQAQLLANANDIDGNILHVTNLEVVGSDATLIDNKDGTWTLKPNSNFNGDIALNYGVSDDEITVNAKIIITVAPAIDPDLVLIGNKRDDTLIGDTGDDTLIGDTGDDTLIGGTGDDVLDGRIGDDTLIGDLGADTSKYLSDRDNGDDIINDFNINEGDKLDLSDLLDYNEGDNLADFLKVKNVDGDTIISVNSDGNGNNYNDATITLTNTNLSLNDLATKNGLVVL